MAAMTGASLLTAASAGAQTSLMVPIYAPVGPYRVYDSRKQEGPINSGETRTLVSEPAGAVWAECFNLTVTGTGWPGWLSVFSADISWPGSSSINWFEENLTLANNAYTEIRESDSGISIRCGGYAASTHFVLDLVAALVFVDVAAGAPMSRSASGRGGLVDPSTRVRRTLDTFGA